MKLLRDFVHGIIVDEIEKARRDTAVDKRVLNQTEIAKYFNVSTTTIKGMGEARASTWISK